MANILAIVGRLPSGEAAVKYAVEVAHRARAISVSCVAVQSRVPRCDAPPLPMGCHSPEAGPSMEVYFDQDNLDGLFTDDELSRFSQTCRTLGDVARVPIETLPHRGTIPEVIDAIDCVTSLICLSRESLIANGSTRYPISRVLSWSPRPLLICPMEHRPWQRIVVAAASDRELPLLSRWGGHWSRCCNIPCEVIAPPPHPIAPPFRVRCGAWCDEWVPGLTTSQRQWDEIVREWSLCDTDLLLVGREATLWPLPLGHGLRLQSLIRHFPGSLGILPSLVVGGVAELLGVSGDQTQWSEEFFFHGLVA